MCCLLAKGSSRSANGVVGNERQDSERMVGKHESNSVTSGFAVTRAPPRIGTANCDDYRVGFSGLLWAMSHLVCKET